MPESRHRYLYERLGDHDFQQLVGALLVNQFPNYIPMALRQADAGRDGLRALDSSKVMVYQVKWSVNGREKDPVSWLDQVVKKEADSLRRLAEKGVRHYALVTNVPSTAKDETGTFDKLDQKLRAYAQEFGYEQMTCFWREALNPWVDNAPTETKWAYAEMLAGWDLIRYIIAEQVGANEDKVHRALIRNVVAAQWEDDQRVKFSQSEVDRERVVDLFVDVTAERVHSPGTGSPERGSVGGAASYLLADSARCALVRGAPGQGKSTLSQYVCQAHRNSFVPEGQSLDSLPKLEHPRFPVRLDLSDYALWLGGTDPWDHAEAGERHKRSAPKGSEATVECFIADLLAHESGGLAVDAQTVQDIFERVPSLVVLDGLDEVGSVTMRRRVVGEIDKFVVRGNASPTPPKVVVTARPSAGELPEPSPQQFEVLALNQLTLEQRNSYLRNWCAVRGIKGKEGRALRTSFKEKSGEPYINELAGNPMQLTILLDLLHEQGAATPTQRTDLYDKYVALLLAREANKHPKSVREHKEELLEIIPFLGWYIHAHTEDSQINGRMSVAELKAAMQHFQRTYGNRESVVDQLFEGASGRLWALTSKVDGTYEFEVLSLREYFAARFLYFYAGEGSREFDRTDVLRELLRRPYWLNTVRFYGGNAKGHELYALTAGIEEELRCSTTPASFLAAWALLTDGVFLRRPREARRVIAAVCSDAGVEVLLPALDRNDIVALPQMPDLPEDDGPDPTWVRLTSAIREGPADGANGQRIRVLRELLGRRVDFDAWWCEEVAAAVGTPQQDSWLGLGAQCEAGAGTVAPFEEVEFHPGTAELLLSTGLVPAPGGQLESALLDAVLDGECPEVTSTRSMPAQVAVALSPRVFLASSDRAFDGGDDSSSRRRSEAIAQLGRAGSEYSRIAKKRAFRAGHRGSTFPWAESAAALHSHVSRCWLASEIAIVGAASPFQLGYTMKPGSTPFGEAAHPSELLAQSRAHQSDVRWWREQREAVDDELGMAEWGLALWCVASPEVVTELLPLLGAVLDEIPARRRRTVLRAARRVAEHGWLRRRPIRSTTGDAEVDRLNRLRDAAPPSTRNANARRGPKPSDQEPSLLKVARERAWLKVDSKPAYR